MEISINDEQYCMLNRDYLAVRADKIIRLIADGQKEWLTDSVRKSFFPIDAVDLGFLYQTLAIIDNKPFPKEAKDRMVYEMDALVKLVKRRKECKYPEIIDAYYTVPLMRQSLYCIRSVPDDTKLSLEDALFIEQQVIALDSIRMILKKEIIAAEHRIMYTDLIKKMKYTATNDDEEHELETFMMKSFSKMNVVSVKKERQE